jgi:hypothetical protein
MSTIYPMYPEAARHEVARRLRAADEERQRRLARHRFPIRRPRSGARAEAACR